MLKVILLIVGSVLVTIFVIVPLVCLLYFCVRDIYLFHSVGKKIRNEKDFIKRLLQQAGFLKDEAADWVSHIILSNPNARESKLAFKIRAEGSEISTDEKIRLHLHVNTKVSKRYLESLTEKGKSNPLRGAEHIVESYLNYKDKGVQIEDSDEP
ncbi:MAG: hypothetical protein H8E17_17020 [Deltaproteobacteria bacterium]|nr:hypothetical protein [Deltaproteobacteria bacterium]